VSVFIWTADDDGDDAGKLQAASAAENAVANDNRHHDEVYLKFFLCNATAHIHYVYNRKISLTQN